MLGAGVSPLSNPPVPLPSLWDRFASEVLSPCEVGMCCWAGLCPTPGHCGCPPTWNGGSLGGIPLPEAPGGCSEGQSKGPLCGSRMVSRRSPGGTLLWLQEDAQPGLCSPALRCCPVSRLPGDASHQCHRSKRLSQRDASPRQRLGDVWGCGVTLPRTGVPTDAPRPPLPRQ